MLMTAIVTVVAAYLIGSVNFAVVFGKIFLKADIRQFGSGNAGATNMIRVGGPIPGILTFVCDTLKGILAAWMGMLIFSYILKTADASWAQPIYGAYLCGVACMLGHVFPIFFEFKGGKGVAVGAGIFVICSPWAIAIGMGVFILSMVITRTVSVSSLLATATVVIMALVFHDQSAGLIPQVILALAMGATIFIRHKSNIKRLLNGEEKKMSFGRNH